MKILYIVLGAIALSLGVLGIFLPILPTTPLLLLAAALWLRGSDRLYNWLLNHKRLGAYIRNFLEYKAIPLHVKIVAVTLIWLTLSYCAFFLPLHIVWRGLFIALAIGVTIHILSYKTLK